MRFGINKKPKFYRNVNAIKKTANNNKIRFVFFGIIILIIFANIGVGFAYRGKLYPKTTLGGKKVGSKSLNEVANLDYIPKSIKLKNSSDTKDLAVKLSDLKPNLNWQETEKSAKKSKSWLPLLDVFTSHQLSLRVTFDETELNKTIENASQYFHQDSVNWEVQIKNDKVKINSGKYGQEVNKNELKNSLVKSITISGQDVFVPYSAIQPKYTEGELKPLVEELQNKAKLSISYSYDSKTTTSTQSEILSWFKIDGNSSSVDKGKITSYLVGVGQKYGIGVKNLSQLVTDTKNAIDNKTKLSAKIEAAPKAIKKYSFCVKAKGVSESLLPDFGAKFISTLNDPRGWSLDGQVSFSKVNNGCDFTAWLTKASLVPSFSSTICDSTWSCSVPPNVIINYDRWSGASPAWNAAGGSLDDYHNMVINHETGHWLGFRHRYCGGKGQLAPVMQQQSIDLQGCKFNPWPSSDEKKTLKASLGL